MNSFLKEAKSALSSPKTRLTIVVGNESCDLDSMTSAILYAWFRTCQPPVEAFAKTYVPLLNISKEDIRLRPEFRTLFGRCNIDEDNVITRSDLTQVKHLQVQDTQWVLVDHNKLEGDLGSLYSKRVVGCIDHHDEENMVPTDQRTEPRVIEKCGSCTSLVLRELAGKLDRGLKDLDDTPPYTTDALKLGLASILIDTNNLQDKTKVTRIDIDMATHIENILHSKDTAWNKDEFFNELSAAKQSLDGLPLNDILRKDYKQWTEGHVKLGMSTVIKDLEFLFEVLQGSKSDASSSASWSEISSNFMKERGLHVWAIMTAYSTRRDDDGDEVFRRQLMIHWSDDASSKLVDSFEQKHGTELELEPIENHFGIPSRGDSWRIWQQGNIAASRKQVGPMLRSVMKQHSKI